MNEYIIVESSGMTDLVKLVNKKLAAGWTLYGSPCTYIYHETAGNGNVYSYNWFAQAMVK
jgi:hypothetical protein